MPTQSTPLITALRVIPVAGRDSMLLNLSGAHGPFFTRNILVLTDNAGRIGVGEVPGGEKIRQTLEDARALVVGQPIGAHQRVLQQVQKQFADRDSGGRGAPFVETNDENLDYYYDYTQSIEEFTIAFKELDIEWKWQQVTNDNYKSVIDIIIASSSPENIVIINLCDGDEINNAPGVNIIRHLKKTGLCFTGADEYFYRTTTSKIIMKQVFEARGVATPPWQIITDEPEDAKSIFKNLGNPVIVKPAISGGSLGVGIHSVVKNSKELLLQYQKLQQGYHGWNLVDGGVFAEKFIVGPEFTTLIVGNCANVRECKIYLPVERVFNSALPPNEKFLSFDRLWAEGSGPRVPEGAVVLTSLNVDEAECRLIARALEVTGGNRTRAAELLGMSIRTLRGKLNAADSPV